MRRFLTILLVSLLAVGASAGRLTVGDGTFLLDGEPYVIKAAELHYPRIPREYWSHRIEMCKALGMNTICMYVFWNVHEPEPGVFDFTGQNDVAEFVRLAGEQGMNVILRPGPYVCAEWEMGGLPWWLLRKEGIELRTQDEYFMERVRLFEERLGQELAPLTSSKGGPIVMVQVENEYGSYGIDKPYVAAIRDIIRQSGFDDVPLFQCDWSSNFLDNGLEDMIWTVNFGCGSDVLAEFAPLREARPTTPLMCSEFWSGWFDEWGRPHEQRPAEALVDGITTMLDNGISFSLYMTHGGTSFGHWAGANTPGYVPHVTSYDYDAPISEWGSANAKYYLLREALSRYASEPLPEVPELPTTIIEIPRVEFLEYSPLRAGATQTVTLDSIVTMEALGVGFGAIEYETVIDSPIGEGALLETGALHDYGLVKVNGRHVATISRLKGERSATLPVLAAGDTLTIYVDAMGRINYGHGIDDYKGILGGITIDGSKVEGWTARTYPDDYGTVANALEIPTSAPTGAPGFYRATFEVETPGDTFLDMSTWGKGQVWINGFPLGRYWNVGPQQTLYLPAPRLKAGKNEIIVLDILGPEEAAVKGQTRPCLDSAVR